MLTWVLAVGLLALLVVAVRWTRGAHAPITLTVLVIALAAGTFVEVRWRDMQATFTHVAQQLSGKPHDYVVCQRWSAALFDADAFEGFVRYNADGQPGRRADLKWDTCHNLAAWVRGSRSASASDAQIIAVHVLTHEAMHLAGYTSEPVAECYAMQHDSQTAQLLGSSPAQGNALAERYWRDMYPRMPDGYRSSDCRPGGALDLHPQTAAWPTG